VRLTTDTDRRLDRIAHGLLAAHVGLIAFSTFAMVTVLVAFNDPAAASEAMGKILASPYFQMVYDLGWRYSGQIYILLGMGAALAHSAPRIGTGRALAGTTCCTAPSRSALGRWPPTTPGPPGGGGPSSAAPS